MALVETLGPTQGAVPLAITHPAGANRVLIAFWHVRSTNSSWSVPTITYGGTSMTALANTYAGVSGTIVGYASAYMLESDLSAFTDGNSYNLTVSGGSTGYTQIGYVFLSGAPQSVPTSQVATAGATTPTSILLTITPSAAASNVYVADGEFYPRTFPLDADMTSEPWDIKDVGTDTSWQCQRKIDAAASALAVTITTTGGDESYYAGIGVSIEPLAAGGSAIKEQSFRGVNRGISRGMA